MACLTHDTVLAFVDGKLSADETSAADAHIDSCGPCRELVAEVARSSHVEAKLAVGDAIGAQDDSQLRSLFAGDCLAARYRIVRLVGRGAMGMVYRARDLTLGTDVALKILPPEAIERPALLRRLQQEVVLGRRITHPNVCRLYDFGEAEGRPFVSMEFIEGETLRDVLGKRRLDAREAVSILYQVAAALAAAHEHGVVHRDLKPTNIMVDVAGKVTVMDFGLARDLQAERSERGVLVGTPAYWAPEQARGERASTRSDLYTLGIVACEAFGAGRPRWDSEPDLTAVPAAYQALVRACLRPDPLERPGSAAEFADRLAQAERGEAAAGAPGEAIRRRPLRARRRVLIGTLLGGALLGGVLATMVGRRSGQTAIRPAGQGQFEPREVARPQGTPAEPSRPAESQVVRVGVAAVPSNARIESGGRLLGVGIASVEFAGPGAEPVEIDVRSPGFVPAHARVSPSSGPVFEVRLLAQPRRSGAAVADSGTPPSEAAPTPGLQFFE